METGTLACESGPVGAANMSGLASRETRSVTPRLHTATRPALSPRFEDNLPISSECRRTLRAHDATANYAHHVYQPDTPGMSVVRSLGKCQRRRQNWLSPTWNSAGEWHMTTPRSVPPTRGSVVRLCASKQTRCVGRVGSVRRLELGGLRLCLPDANYQYDRRARRGSRRRQCRWLHRAWYIHTATEHV